jgi:hypothetical protein
VIDDRVIFGAQFNEHFVRSIRAQHSRLSGLFISCNRAAAGKIFRRVEFGENIPQGLKPAIIGSLCGTAEAVPFQNRDTERKLRVELSQVSRALF